jgi:hypothetical protein
MAWTASSVVPLAAVLPAHPLDMSTLPDPKVLAALLSNVTRTMCGTTFSAGDPLTRGESLCGQMVLIPLTGSRSFNVIVSSDTRGSRALGAAFYGCDEKDLTKEMIDDAIGELLNMVAGQISAMLHLDLTLGLPHPTNLAEIVASGGSGIEDALLFHSEGKVDLWLWIFETHPPAPAEVRPPTKRSILRSLLTRISSSFTDG